MLLILISFGLTGCSDKELNHEEKVQMCFEMKEIVDGFAFGLMMGSGEKLKDVNRKLEKITDRYDVKLDNAKKKICIDDYSVKNNGKFLKEEDEKRTKKKMDEIKI